MLEVGGGAGVHGRHLAVHFAYTHSDFSAAMCASARSFGLRSIRLDGLKLATAPVADAYVAIELSTLRDTDRSLRLHQLDSFADAVPLGATLVTSNGRGTMHTLDDEDVNELVARGFRHEHTAYWGVIPKLLWKVPLGMVERLLSRWPLGIRKICVFTRVEVEELRMAA